MHLFYEPVYKVIEYRHYESERVGVVKRYYKKSEYNTYMINNQDLQNRRIIDYTVSRKNNIIVVNIYF